MVRARALDQRLRLPNAKPLQQITLPLKVAVVTGFDFHVLYAQRLTASLRHVHAVIDLQTVDMDGGPSAGWPALAFIPEGRGALAARMPVAGRASPDDTATSGLKLTLSFEALNSVRHTAPPTACSYRK